MFSVYSTLQGACRKKTLSRKRPNIYSMHFFFAPNIIAEKNLSIEGFKPQYFKVIYGKRDAI